jgi:hypothetical protein
MPQGLQKPTNQVLAEMIAGKVEEYEVGANATEAKMLPGTAVVLDTVAHALKESGDEPKHFVGVLEVRPDYAMTTGMAVGVMCKVLTGHFKCKVRLAASENISIDDNLTIGTDGLFKELAVGALGAQGVHCGKALEASNVTTVAWIMAEIWTSAGEAAAAS